MIPAVQDKRDHKRTDGFGESILPELQESFGNTNSAEHIVTAAERFGTKEATGMVQKYITTATLITVFLMAYARIVKRIFIYN